MVQFPDISAQLCQCYQQHYQHYHYGLQSDMCADCVRHDYIAGEFSLFT